MISKSVASRWLNGQAKKHNGWLGLERLEDRTVPTLFHPQLGPEGVIAPAATSFPTGLTPVQVRHAYGFDKLTFHPGGGTVAANGSGQTIAIVDAYDDPNITTDLAGFSAAFGLQQMDGQAGRPWFRRVGQDGSSNLPGRDPAGAGTNNWEVETALDVEWAHAIAPGANILLVEANSNTSTIGFDNPFTGESGGADLYVAVNWAKRQPGVSVVSMSFGGKDNTGQWAALTTPEGHAGVTFVVSSGDNGVVTYPAGYDDALAVGGTVLTVDGANNISTEMGWSGSGGGLSDQAQPNYQAGVLPNLSQNRLVPDVGYAAAGFSILDSYNNPTNSWSVIGGTSAGAPQWAALVSIVNQGRAFRGQPTEGSPGFGTVMNQLYTLPAGDFNDITTGSNVGFSAGPGYDLVTGLGSPRADLIVPDLCGGGGGSVPTSPNLSYKVPVNGTLKVNAANGVLRSASDVEGDAMTAEPQRTAYGSLALQRDGSFSYTPRADFIGTDQFSFRIHDSDGYSAEVFVNVTVGSLPVAGDHTYTVPSNVSIQVDQAHGLLSDAVNPAGLPLGIGFDSFPQHGRLDWSALDGSFTYTPAPGFAGQDQFTFVPVYIGKAAGNEATATINVIPSALLDGNTGKLTIHSQLDASSDSITIGMSTLRGFPFITTSVSQVAAPGVTYSGTSQSSFLAFAVSSIEIDTGTGFLSTVTLTNTPNVPITINSAGQAIVVLGGGGNAQGVQGTIALSNTANSTSLLVDDSTDSAPHTVTMQDVGDSTFGQISGLTPATVNYRNGQLFTVGLKTGTGVNTVNLFSTGRGVVSLEGYSGNTTVNVGNGTTQNIRSGVSITNPPDHTTINIDDSTDNVSRTATVDTWMFDSSYGEVAGLASGGASIFFKYADTLNLTVNTGAGGNTVDVWATGVPTTLVDDGPDNVNVGNAGSVQGILKPLTLTSPLLFPARWINVDDSADTTARTVVVDTSIPTDQFIPFRVGRIAGLAPGDINFKTIDTSHVTIRTGSTGGNTTNVLSTGTALTLVSDGSNNFVTVGNATNGVQDIQGVLTIDEPGGFSNRLAIDDSANTMKRTVTTIAVSVSNPLFTSILGLAPAEIAVRNPSTFGSMTISGGSVGNSFTVADFGVSQFTLFGGAGSDTINLGDGSRPLSHFSLIVDGQGGTDTLTIDDQANTVAQTYAILTGVFSHVNTWGASVVRDQNVENIVFNGGKGGNTFNINGTPLGMTTTLNTGTGSDTINVGDTTGRIDNIQGNLAVNGQGGTDVLNLNDQATVTGRSFDLTNTTLRRSGVAPITYGSVERMRLNAGLGNDSIRALSIAPGAAVTVNGGGGTNTLVGATTNTWQITGHNAGTVNGSVAFVSFQNLTGGTGADIFGFARGTGISVEGTLDGQGGTNTLDYSTFATGVTVNLTTGSATGTGKVTNLANIVGSAFNDTLTGNSQKNVFVGGAGNDTLTAGSGPAILVGGDGSDILNASSAGADLLIGGRTGFDTNRTAMNAYMAEWSRTDLTYQQRMAHLKGTAGGLNGSFTLSSTTVFADHTSGLKDTLNGSAVSTAALDWFFATGMDTLTNRRSGEVLTTVA